MKHLPPELDAILQMLPKQWTLSSLEWWAMGWIADVDARPKQFELVSDRGYIDVYEMVDGHPRQVFPPEERRTFITPEQVCELLTKAAAQ
jgi:hypothetical protein